MKPLSKCSGCAGQLELGWVPDASYGSYLQLHWHPGSPEKATFFGLPAGSKVELGKMQPIVTHRCVECGMLHFQAQPKAK